MTPTTDRASEISRRQDRASDSGLFRLAARRLGASGDSFDFDRDQRLTV
jgi:hypothetical protein